LADGHSAVTTAAPPQATNAATPGVRATAASLEPSPASIWCATCERTWPVPSYMVFGATENLSWHRAFECPLPEALQAYIRSLDRLYTGASA
jgi:hypothetical protein